MTDLEKDKILLLAHSIGKMARELESIKRLLKEIAGTPQTETKTETQNSNLTFEKADERCKGCGHYKLTCDLFSEICRYEPKDEPQKKEVEWVYNKRERLWYPYSNGELLFKTEPQTDCNGCKFVGTYDTEFPCANCSRKIKDYYAKIEPQTERSE